MAHHLSYSMHLSVLQREIVSILTTLQGCYKIKCRQKFSASFKWLLKNKAGNIREGFIKSAVSEVFIIIILLPVQNRCLLEQLFHLKKFSWKKPEVLCTEQRPMALLYLKACMHCYNNIHECLSCLKG